MKNYTEKDWRKLHDGCSGMAKDILNPSWQDPLMRIAQAAMELEELTKRCVLRSNDENPNKKEK